MKTILGLDISSAAVGFTVLSVDNNEIIKIIEHNHLKPLPKDGYNLIERLDAICNDLDKLCKRIAPDMVIIEDIIQFMGKNSSANTIIMLACFNRAIALQVYRRTGKIPFFLSVIDIRSKIGKFLGIRKIEKEDIPNILQNYFGKDAFKIRNVKIRGKNKGQPSKETYDEADSAFAAFACILQLGLVK